jgi:FkbM family methyltransferase
MYISVINKSLSHNGKAMRDGGAGCSGSDQTDILVAEYLASIGHHVDFVINNCENFKFNQVNYINDVNTLETDVIISVYWSIDYFTNLEFPKLKKVIIHSHWVDRHVGVKNFSMKYPNVEFLAVHPSEWCLLANQYTNPMKFTKDYVIYNSLMYDCLDDVSYEREPSLAWNACYERGGHIAEKIAKNMGFPFFSHDYNDSTSVDKRSIFRTLGKASYFVYPLVLENDTLHKDTFACCVAEALSMGVIVITWNVAALPEVYKESPVHFLDPPDHIKERALNYDFISEPWFNSDEAVGLLQGALVGLEADPGRRLSLRKAGVEYARKKFDCVSQWKNIIEFDKISYSNYTPNIPEPHIDYLKTLTIAPKVIYDIGSCVGSWTKEALAIWPDARVIMFDANENFEDLYKDREYHIGVLSDADYKTVKWFNDIIHPSGNSYYREVSNSNENYITKTTRTLDSIVRARNFPLPDLIKIDVQGSEVDILKGAADVLKNARDIIVELQHVEYNKGAPLAPKSMKFIESLGYRCVAEKFMNNGPDADYHFTRI